MLIVLFLTFQLAHALSVFGIHARGPQMDNYIQKLMKECDKYWKHGRQMCEVLSLTGNLCNLLLHKAPTGEAVSSESTEKYASYPLSFGLIFSLSVTCFI